MPSRSLRQFAIPVLILLVGLGVWLAHTDDDDGRPPSPAQAEAQRSIETAGARTGEQGAAAESGTVSNGVEREVSADVATTAPSPASLVTFRGRCVDENGNPLSEVTVAVDGWSGNTQRQQAYEKDHGKVVFNDPEDVLTGADGRFEIRFAPPPPYQFSLRLNRDDLVSMHGRWGRLEPGKTKDFGDIGFETGARVHGRLVDKDGALVLPTEKRTRVYVNRFNRQDRPRGEIHPRESASAKVQPDGTFEIEQRVGRGMWDLNTRGVTLGPDAQGKLQDEFEIDEVIEQIDVLVVRPSEIQTLTGTVVDQSGQPVRRATINAHGRSGTGWIIETNREGRFELKRRAGDEEEGAFQIEVRCDGYETFVSERSYAWGDREVLLQITAGSSLEITVRSSIDGQPVERYGVWLHKRRQGFGWTGMNDSMLGGWDHPDGLTRLERVLPGRYHLEIGVAEESPLAVATADIEIQSATPSSIEIMLPRQVRQPLTVRFADGEPAAGSLVQLIDTHGQEFPTFATTRVRSTGRMSSSDVGHEVTSAKVDAAGHAILIGPEGSPLVLRVSGEHGPHIVEEFRLSEEQRDIVLPAAATISFRVEPQDVVDRWFEILGTFSAEHAAKVAPRVVLIDRADPRNRFPKRPRNEDPSPNGMLDESGRARLTQVPAGSWKVVIGFPESSSEAEGQPHPRFTDMLAELVTMPGEQIDMALDASGERTGSVELTTSLNGEPFQGTVYLVEPDTEQFLLVGRIQTDENGVGRADVPVGVHAARLQATLGSTMVFVPAEIRIVATAGQTTRVSLDASLVDRSLTVMLPDGSPYEGVTPTVRGVDRLIFPRIDPSENGNGYRVAGAPGPYRVLVPIRSRSTKEAMQEARTAIYAD